MWVERRGAAGLGPAGWLLAALLLLTLAAVVVLVVVLLATRRSTQPQGSASTPPAAGPSAARVLLDERLARGEIDPEDYQRRRALLEGPDG
ncbi:MAG TPA: SHOCT domain-containing protein [Actinomycetes bacterium]